MNNARGPKPKKSLGQNFLTNASICQKIITACSLDSNDEVLEIGPGKGAITQWIVPEVKKFTAIEKDDHLFLELTKQFQQTHVHLTHSDILQFDLSKLSPNTKIIGNLPYNIATPIIEKVLQHHTRFQQAFFMLQLEHGKRLTAQPHCKDYGSLSCFVQYYAQPKILFKIKPTAFFPAPKVQSCFVQFDLYSTPPLQAKNPDHLFKLIQTCFQQRRKMLQNSLQPYFENKETLLQCCQTLKIKSTLRAENLHLKDYIRLSDCLTSA